METQTKNKTQIKITTIQHKAYMSEGVGSWGNGYLEIPREHFAFSHLCGKIDEQWGFEDSLCGEEITYYNITKEGLKIGFDTLHSYNDKTHDKKWVLNKCNQIKDYINSESFKEEIRNDIKWYIGDLEIRIEELKQSLNKLK
tara:strand:- start:1322 stop:1747 length:426 start_codon:yes stop_codon:yes gene_type:complete